MRNRPLPALPIEEDFVEWVREQGAERVAVVVRAAREADGPDGTCRLAPSGRPLATTRAAA